MLVPFAAWPTKAQPKPPKLPHSSRACGTDAARRPQHNTCRCPDWTPDGHGSGCRTVREEQREGGLGLWCAETAEHILYKQEVLPHAPDGKNPKTMGAVTCAVCVAAVRAKLVVMQQCRVRQLQVDKQQLQIKWSEISSRRLRLCQASRAAPVPPVQAGKGGHR